MNASQVWVGQVWESKTIPARGLPERVWIHQLSGERVDGVETFTEAHVELFRGAGSRSRPRRDIAIDVLLRDWRRV